MGEWSAYYIPEIQKDHIGKAEEIADQFWEKGIFLATPDNHIYAKLREYKKNSIALPQCEHGFSYSEMGLADEAIEVPVPSNVYDAKCPECNAEVYDEFTEALSIGDDSVPLPNRNVSCKSCGHIFRALKTKATDPGFKFTRFYLWVSDIYEEDWEPSFKKTVESILGPCLEIIAWDT